MRRVLRLLLLLPLAAYIALIILGIFSDRFIFQPHISSYRDTDLVTAYPASDLRFLKIPSGKILISAVYLPNAAASHVLLFSHGNAEDLGDVLPLLQACREAGLGVFAYDYRGYGTSAGASSERWVYEDVNAAYDYLTKELRIAPQQIISFGRSLGSAAAIELASKRQVGGLVVHAPFLTAFRVLTRVPLLPLDRFRNIEKISRVRCPVLVIHGRADRVIPSWHGQKLFELANQPKRFLWLDDADHNDFGRLGMAGYAKSLREFSLWLDQLRAGSGSL